MNRLFCCLIDIVFPAHSVMSYNRLHKTKCENYKTVQQVIARNLNNGSICRSSISSQLRIDTRLD